MKAEEQAAAWTGLGLERLTPSMQIYWRKVILADRGRKIDSATMDTGPVQAAGTQVTALLQFGGYKFETICKVQCQVYSRCTIQ